MGKGITRLVIVESMTKAKKIQSYLGDGYVVTASVGHIRDLPRRAADIPEKYKKEPWARLGVDVNNNFQPLYLVSADRKKKVTELRSLLRSADELYLATDPDREGEAIAWHLLETLKPTIPVRRMVFNEITKQAIVQAAEHTRDLDMHLVDAQETRRILDRLYGYEVSPVLWKKIMPRLSAGRVQSVATRVIVERERERMSFISSDYWGVTTTLSQLNATASSSVITFDANLVGVDGKRAATGRDFTSRGEIKKPDEVLVITEDRAHVLAEALKDAQLSVTDVEEKPYTRRPYPPFMTSTLQQEAGRKLHYTSARTMRIAQRLYENGLITYMRTDSTTLSRAGQDAARKCARELFGEQYVPKTPRQYTRKVKNSQEAHEAIRPAGETFATPDSLRSRLDAEEYKLYDLIWRRTVASQMADAVGKSLRVAISGDVDTNGQAGFGPKAHVECAATGRSITFPGFLRVYVEISRLADGRDVADNAERELPSLNEGDGITVQATTAEGHKTHPPARYTEASLVKKMEDLGIGRPSTYAAIIRTIQDRGYVFSRGNALVPSWVAFAVVGLLEQNFASLVDYDFTSSMEDELDDIAVGRENGHQWLSEFYFGADDDPAPVTPVAPAHSDPGGTADSNGTADSIAHAGGLKAIIDANLESIDARSVNSIYLFDDAEGRPVTARVGRYGTYLERVVGTTADGEKDYQRANLPESATPDEITLDVAERLFAVPRSGRELGTNPETGRTIVVKDGRYGPYVTELLTEQEQQSAEELVEKIITEERAAEDAERAAAGKRAKNWETKTAEKQKEKRKAEIIEERLKPQAASLFESMDPTSITLDEALKLLSLPRVVGTDPSDGEEITAQNGRFGPYIRKGSDSRSLDSEERLFTITLDEARQIFAEPRRRGRAAAKPPLKQLGTNDVSGRPMVVKEGRFGPYVTDGVTNASLGRGDTPEAMTDARACELLSERRAKDAESGGATTSTRKSTKRTSKTTKRTTKSTTKRSTKSTTKRATKRTTRK